jgi:MFS transporter, SP family, arabinose:H+ symporter
MPVIMKQYNSSYIILVAFTAAIGGFLLGFDGSVISGAAPFYKSVFGLQDGSVLFGFSVSCLIWGCIFGNFFAGPISDKIGRKPTLLIAAFLFIVSSLITALASGIIIFIIGRILAGVAVGFAILVAPVFIAEVAPPKKRGWLVSFNQLLIVIGLSSAYFINYFILKQVEDPLTNWRWMLGVEAIPSVLYFFLILLIPESPRWLLMKGEKEKALSVMTKVGGAQFAHQEIKNIEKSLGQKKEMSNIEQAKEFFSKKMRLIFFIALGLGIFQQLSGINSVLYYAPMIFELAGSNRDAAFVQAIAIGIVFLVVTVIAMFIIDRFGRKPLLYAGISIMAISLLITGLCFRQATYSVTNQKAETAACEIFKSTVWKEVKKQHPALINFKSIELKKDNAIITKRDGSNISIDFANQTLKQFLKDKEIFINKLTALQGLTFNNESAFQTALITATGKNDSFKEDAYLPILIKGGIHINSMLVLISILGFIAGFSLSLGPVMWALFSEIFPNRLRGMAISIAGTVNSFTSFVVATFFPVQLKIFGTSVTFFIYAGCMFLCLLFVWKYVVETKGKSLEEIELQLIK